MIDKMNSESYRFQSVAFSSNHVVLMVETAAYKHIQFLNHYLSELIALTNEVAEFHLEMEHY